VVPPGELTALPVAGFGDESGAPGGEKTGRKRGERK